MTGSAYCVSASTERFGKVFLWDMFNPWAGWLELNSTHPLTGKRIRALSTYAEQLDLKLEFDMARVMREGYKLSKQRLYRGFVLDLALYLAEALGLLVGLVVGFLMTAETRQLSALLAFPLIGCGVGIVIKTLVLFPDLSYVSPTNVLDLMADPYASPLRGTPAKLNGKLIGRGQAGYVFGSDLQFQDPTGLLYLRYTSRFGPLGNVLFGLRRVNPLIGSQAAVKGWFRRGGASSLDLSRLCGQEGTVVTSHPRFWSFLLAAILILGGFVLSSR
jgi:hypothetical protein